jgi:hypothetical protein
MIKNELEKLLEYLNQSTDSIYSSKGVLEIKKFINETINNIDCNKNIEIDELKILIAPTGNIQDISIDNGWGEEFIKIANDIENTIGT